MVSVRQIVIPEETLPCDVPSCTNDIIGYVLFLNIAFEFVRINTCGDHSQLLQAAQGGVVEVIRYRDKQISEMTKEELKAQAST